MALPLLCVPLCFHICNSPAETHQQRIVWGAGLVLYKGLVYAAFGSHCDRPPYFPWLFAFSADTLAIEHFWTSATFICALLLARSSPAQQAPFRPLACEVTLHCFSTRDALER